ncbi:MOSC N-terminal beta barrel domain-containing protein [Nonomuraea sp. B5E05]|uniref:MOSC domain-containing protein n=1 Tax=Nonomuraea sp. B5E05 TaxID=3153569 RepID=UPI003261107B
MGRRIAVDWISVAPVKGLRLLPRSEVRLTADGVPGDRAFFVVDGRNVMISMKRVGLLAAVVPDHDPVAGRLALRFPDGRSVADTVRLGAATRVRFFDTELRARPVEGEFSAALSEHCGVSLRLMATPPGWVSFDRRQGVVSVLSLASLERLREVAGLAEPIDHRRFRMTFGFSGLDAHEEDRWVGRDLQVGEAVLRIAGHVGRCAATTRDADTGVMDLKTLRHLAAYRGDLAATEPLPFGVHAQVVRPGPVSVGDPVMLLAGTVEPRSREVSDADRTA